MKSRSIGNAATGTRIFIFLFDAPYNLSLSPTRFRNLKRRLEYSWLRITSADARRKYRGNEKSFREWMADSQDRPPGCDWNKANRRVLDIRRVKQTGDGAVYEVVKYISKSNRFLDIPEAVAGFLSAARGVRVIQDVRQVLQREFRTRYETPQVHALRVRGGGGMGAHRCVRHECCLSGRERMLVFETACIDPAMPGFRRINTMALSQRNLKEIEFVQPGEMVEGRLLSATPMRYRDGGTNVDYLVKRLDGGICTFKGTSMLNKLLSRFDVGLVISVRYLGKDGAPVADGMSPKKLFEVMVDENSKLTAGGSKPDPLTITDEDIPF